MTISIDSATIAKYAHVCAVRRSDGMRLAATRKVMDVQIPGVCFMPVDSTHNSPTQTETSFPGYESR